MVKKINYQKIVILGVLFLFISSIYTRDIGVLTRATYEKEKQTFDSLLAHETLTLSQQVDAQNFIAAVKKSSAYGRGAAELQKQLDDKIASMAKANQQASSTKSIAAITIELDEARKEIILLKGQISGKSHKDILDACQKEKNICESTKAQQGIKIAELESKNTNADKAKTDAIKEAIEKREKELNNIHQSGLTKTMQEKETAKVEYESKLKQNEATIKRLEEEKTLLTTNKTTIDQKQTELAGKQKEIAEKDKKIHGFETEKSSLIQNHKMALAQKQTELDVKIKALADKQKELDAKIQELVIVDSDLEKAGTMNEQLEKEKNELEKKNQALTKEKVALEAKNKELLEINKDLANRMKEFDEARVAEGGGPSSFFG